MTPADRHTETRRGLGMTPSVRFAVTAPWGPIERVRL